MYLSQLALNPRNRDVRRDLARPYEMHRTLMRAFPNDLPDPGTAQDQGTGRILFRIDEDEWNPILIMQSHIMPDWSWMEPSYLSRPARTKEFSLNLAAGQMVAFRLRANPTCRKQFGTPGDATSKKRIGIYKLEDQEEWARRRLLAGGFQIAQLSINNEGKVLDKTRLHDAGAAHKLELLSVLYEGILIINDPELAVQTIYAGIGSGKAFGYGLISLARPN